MQAIGYVRVSTDEQKDHGVSLDNQKQRIQDYCKFQGFELAEIIEDGGVSAGKPLNQREGGKKLINRIKKDKIKIIISVKLDRLFRDAIDCLQTTKEWDKAGIALHLLDMGGSTLDTSTAMGRMFLTMAAGFAEMERNLIGERTTDALQFKKKNHEVYSPVPLGFKRNGDKLEEDEVELDTIKEIYRLRREGLSFHKIADMLNQQGIPTKRKGGKWYASTVSYIVKNRLYEEVA